MTPDVTGLEKLKTLLDQALGKCDGPACLLTGYLANADQGRCLLAFAEQARDSGKLAGWYLDPVFGDDAEGVYVDPAIVGFFCETALPAANCVLPNRFELSKLAGVDVPDVESAVAAARALIARGPEMVLATSVPAPGGRLANVLVTEAESRAAFVEQRPLRAKGTGDMLSAAFVGAMTAGVVPSDALQLAVDLVSETASDASVRDLRELDPIKSLNKLGFVSAGLRNSTYIAQLERNPTK
ncbi:MAG: bifunctional hydroxymethylpyrimidine kinase/phosphomethylpyrimidine kinase [Rhodospirillales bacterium]|nr:bifunctional hydroxymethylpyrimidine kinase/phosphomethylpyrimidine kinase [Rhodospirillales bacterium]